MKKLFILFVPVLFVFGSCSKGTNNEVSPISSTNGGGVDASTQGSVVVKCDNCEINYGMPDQFKTFDVTGTSPMSYFNYASGYTLQANIYAQDHSQDITYTVYDTKGKVVYQNKVTQSTEGFWAVNVLLP